MNVVLDSNIIVGAATSLNGPSGQVVMGWQEGLFLWVTSLALMREIERVLTYPRVEKYLAWDKQRLNEFLSRMTSTCTVVAPLEEIRFVRRDPDDNRVLEAAVAGQADYIVTNDNDLLELGSDRVSGIHGMKRAWFEGEYGCLEVVVLGHDDLHPIETQGAGVLFEHE